MTAKHSEPHLTVKVVPFFNTPLCIVVRIFNILFYATAASLLYTYTAAAATLRFVHIHTRAHESLVC